MGESQENKHTFLLIDLQTVTGTYAGTDPYPYPGTQ